MCEAIGVRILGKGRAPCPCLGRYRLRYWTMAKRRGGLPPFEEKEQLSTKTRGSQGQEFHYDWEQYTR